MTDDGRAGANCGGNGGTPIAFAQIGHLCGASVLLSTDARHVRVHNVHQNTDYGSGLPARLCTLLRAARRTGLSLPVAMPVSIPLSSISLLTELWDTRRFGGGGVENPLPPAPGNPE